MEITELNGTKVKAQTEVQRAYDFVAGVIESCRDTYQIQAAQRLISFFKERYYEKHGGKNGYEMLMKLLVAKIPFLIDLT